MSGPTLHEAIKKFERAQRAEHVPEGTVRQYRSVLNRLQTQFPGRQFAGIKTNDLSQFLYGEQGITVGRKPATGTTYRSALNSFFAYGALMGWTKTQTVVPRPVFRTKAVRAKTDPMPTRLSPSALVLMLERSEHPMMRGMIAVGIGTALRISDILKLKVGDVDFHIGEIAVWVQKTGRFDAMPITVDLEEELRRYLGWLTQETGATGRGPAYLFPGWTRRNAEGTGHLYYVPDATQKCSYPWALKRLNTLYEECGIPVQPKEAWHVIRRSVARIYFDQLRHEISHDHALRQTAALLGHKNTETTERYLGLHAERLARNESLRGKRFIGVTPDATVTPIRRPG
ncbi:tyrosine-type recombinase/integrase [Streptomyces sp. I8-5]|uniref:tyrosine-type recombinase/integrase n=1 Tax=Streptomyces sp. I8-5 TaxID=3104277 RepID=UPI00386F774B